MKESKEKQTLALGLLLYSEIAYLPLAQAASLRILQLHDCALFLPYSVVYWHN